MKRTSKVFLKFVTVFVGIFAFAFLLWELHIEGRNVNATLFQIYFNDPFLVYAYVASIPFFVGLYHVVKGLGHFEQDNVLLFKSLRTIKYCALAIIGFAAFGEIFIFLNKSDDRAGGVFIGLVITLGSTLVAIVAARLESKLKNMDQRP